MKPQQLKLQNFGPFIDETIDFSRLTEASLFLISGKTGTGKTTIFDGMTYALFGETSGRIRSGKEMRSVFSSPEEETAVVFTFEHQELLYRIMRKPEQLLRKKRGTGMTTQSAKVELTICELDGKELRQYSKQREVEEQIRELLHLDAKQFSQIVLLPQGEFRTFLIANSQEKETVLRHLFGTQIYQFFAEKLKEKLKQANKKLDTSNTQLDVLQEQFTWEEAPGALSYPEFIEKADQQIEDKLKDLSAEKETLTAEEKKQTAKEADYYQAKELFGLFQQKDRLDSQKAALSQQESAVAMERETLKTLEWAEKQKAKLEKVEELTYKEESLITKEKEISQGIDENETATLSYQESCKAFEKEAPLHQQNQEKLLEIKQKIPLLLELQKQRKSADKTSAEITVQQKLQEDIEVQLAASKEKLAVYQSQQGNEAGLLKQQAYVTEGNHLLKEAQKAEKHSLDQKKLVKTQEKNRRVLEEKLVQNLQLIDEKDRQSKKLQSESASMQIARLSLKLIEGEPCPICGSREHPAVHEESRQISLDEIMEVENQAETAEAELAKLQKKQTELETQKTLLQEQMETSAKQQAELNQESAVKQEDLISFLQEKIPQKLSALRDCEEALAGFAREIDDGFAVIRKAKKESEGLQKKQEELSLQLEEKSRQLRILEAAGSQLKGAIESLVSQGVEGQPEVLEDEQKKLETWLKVYENRQHVLNEKGQALKQQETRLNEQQRQVVAELEAVRTTLAQQEETLAQVLAEKQPAIKKTDLKQLLEETCQIERLQKKVSGHETQVKVNQGQLDEVLKKTEGKEIPQLEVYEEALDQIRSSVKVLQESYYSRKNLLDQNKKVLQNFSELYQKNQRQLEMLKQLSELTKAISGDNLKKTSLERYVLQTYLQEVLHVANKRLALLTRNRYQFELSAEVGSYRSQTGLEINVYDDDAGSSRSVHTLSGGESFIAALALALSLAEVIQSQAGGVSIEALFIDEGFGSLDEDALNMAMEALETIESEGRMIGIISHVKELKERVPQQILVTGSGNGQSSISYQL